MTPTWILLVCLVALWWARKGTRVLAVLIVSTAFGSSAAFHASALGGAPITPTLFLIPFFVWWVWRRVGLQMVSRSVSLTSPGLWLLVFVAWATAMAFIAPRYLEGETWVYITSRSEQQGAVLLAPLAPTSTNLTQSVYLITNLIVFFAMAAAVRLQGGLEMAWKGLCALAIVNVTAGLLNLIEGYGGVPTGLELIRNANYALLNAQFVLGLLRVHGTFSETSAFSSFTASLFFLFLFLWVRGFRVKLTAFLAISNGTLLLLTTSTTAYVAIGGLLVLLIIYICTNAVFSRGAMKFRSGSVVVLGGTAVGLVVLLASPAAMTVVADFLSATVWRKLESDSGIERTEWARQSVVNFAESFGLGIGAGSARGSGFLSVLVGNGGVVGASAFALFMLFTLIQRLPKIQNDIDEVGRACKAASLAALIAACVAATMIDMGTSIYIFAGIAAGCTGLPAKSNFRGVNKSEPTGRPASRILGAKSTWTAKAVRR